MSKIGLIIVCFNSESLIRDCLDSIYRYNDIGNDLDVILVDNNSREQLSFFQMIRKEYPAEIKLVASAENGGYGKGNNLGASHTNAPYLIFMNPDVRLVKPIFTDLIRVFENNLTVGLIGLSFADGSCPFYFKPEYYTVWNLFRFKSVIKKTLFNSRQLYLPGSFLMFKYEAFHCVNSFDENIFLYFEEPDISNRLQKAGYEIHWMKELEVFHLTHQRKFNEVLVRFELQSLDYYCQKFNFDRMKVFSQYKKVNQVKYLIALLTGNKDKQIFFRGWVRLINERMYETNN